MARTTYRTIRFVDAHWPGKHGKALDGFKLVCWCGWKKIVPRMSPRRDRQIVPRSLAALWWAVACLWLGACFLTTLAVADQAVPPLPVTSLGRELAASLQAQGYTTLSLKRTSGPHLETTARINGVTGLFLVDTGAQITVINRGSVDKFNLTPFRTAVRVYGAVGGPGERIEAALASRLELGPCVAAPFFLGISDLSTLNQGRQRKLQGNFDGIIGADVLQSFAFIIDCGSLQLFARPAGGAKPDGAGAANLARFLHSRGYGQVEMRRVSISDFEVLANVNKRRALWLVDTGAAITLLDTALSQRAGIRLRRTDLSVGGAGGGRSRISIGIVDNLRLSSLRVRSAVIATSDISATNAALQENGKPPIDGYLGADFLRQKGAVIDCAQMMLYLRK